MRAGTRRRRRARSSGSPTSSVSIPEALRTWVRQADIDGGVRRGTTTDEAQRIAELEREVRGLRRANTILKQASAFFCGGARPTTGVIVDFIDVHREEHGVEPIVAARENTEARLALSTYYAHQNREPTAPAVRDAELTEEIKQVHADNLGVYGARKVHAELNRNGTRVARCTVERLMRAEGIRREKTARPPSVTARRPSAPRTW